MPRFAANLSFLFAEWPFIDRFTAAADHGFTAVEYLFPYEFDPDEIAAALARNGLTQVLFNAAPGNWAAGERGLAALPDRSAEFKAGFLQALNYAAASGTKDLHVLAGNGGSRKAYEHALRWASEAAKPLGIDILIEPLNQRDMPGYFLNSFDQAADIIAALNLPNLKLQFDIYHRQIIHGDVLTGLRSLMPLIGHVQIASVPARHEPGTGELNDKAVLAELDALGYQGFVGCEYRPARSTVEGLTWLQDIVSTQPLSPQPRAP